VSRIIAWRRFIELRFEDDSGNAVEAFDARPTPGTRVRMARHRLLARARPNGLALFYRTNPERTPSLLGEIGSRVRLGFTLHLREADFFDRHRPDLTAATGAAIQLDNIDAGGAILPDGAILSAGPRVDVADAVEIGRRVHPVRLDLTLSSPNTLDVRDPISAAVVLSAPVLAATGAPAATVALDLPAAEGVLYRLAEVPAGPVNRRVYLDDAIAAAGASGVVDLYWETAQTVVPIPAGVVYRAVFERR
jgi:hypothetical protein